jgi:hypothetical protein
MCKIFSLCSRGIKATGIISWQSKKKRRTILMEAPGGILFCEGEKGSVFFRKGLQNTPGKGKIGIRSFHKVFETSLELGSIKGEGLFF